MSNDGINAPVRRRTILKAGLALGAVQVASPFVVKSLADEPVKIGLDNPLTGTYAALGNLLAQTGDIAVKTPMSESQTQCFMVSTFWTNDGRL